MKTLTKILISVLILFSISGCYLLKSKQEYYGISVKDTKKVVFLVDISGSMEGKAETDAAGNIIASATSAVGNKVANAVGGIGGKIIRKQTSTQLTKLGKAKKELIPAIRGLSEDTYFTIIVFENNVKMWRKSLVQATSTNKNLAVVYLDNLKSGGGTNVYGALEKSFDLAGDANNSSAVLGVETIFLLSDGSPTAGKISSTSEILNKVKNWNSLQRVVINTIGLGDDQDKEFLSKLATENKGVYIEK